MSTPSWINSLNDQVLRDDMILASASGTVTEAGLLQLFTDLVSEISATTTTLSASQFSDLKLIASNLNIGETASSYVTYIVDALINGNAANAFWTGGSDSATLLGNLAIGSTATQISELEGKWFLGIDLPSSILYTSVDSYFSFSYSAVSSPVYSPNGPSINDINQGNLGDCYLLSVLAEVAYMNPSVIQSMITSNGDNTYGARFFVNGVAKYVTVNNILPNGGTLFNQASYIWGSLIEKAYAQVQASGVITGNGYDYGNSYSTIGFGGWQGRTLYEITGATTIIGFEPNGSLWNIRTFYKDVTQTSFITGLSGQSVLSLLISYIANGNDLVLSSRTSAVDNNGRATLIASHSMSIYGYDSVTGLLEIRNPWGTKSGQGYNTTFEVSLDTLLAAGDEISVDNVTSNPVVNAAFASDAAALQANSSVTSFTVADAASQVFLYIDSLIIDTKLTAITLIDANAISITAAQSVTGNPLLTKITGTFILIVSGTSGPDTLSDTANSYATLTGGAGNDTFIVSGTATITDFSNGLDKLIVYNGATAWVTAYGNFTATSSTISNGLPLINANGHNVSFASAGGSTGWTLYNNSPTGVSLIGSAHNDTIYGGWVAGMGNDTLTGGAGADTFSILSGTNTITDLGNGADILTVSPGAIVWATAYGNFTATSSTINNSLGLINANGYNVSFASAGGSTGWTLYNTSPTGVSLVGSAHNDTIYGGWGAGIGNDTLTGGAGADTFCILSGINTISDLGNGADILTVSPGAIVWATAYGTYTATSATISNGLALLNANGYNVSFASAGGSTGWTLYNTSPTGVSLAGSAHNDTIYGGWGAGTGNDTLTGGAGADTFSILSGTNTITDLGNGADILTVSPGAIVWATAYGTFTATSSTISNGLPLLNANGHNVSFASAGGSTGWTLYNTSPTGVTLVGSAQNDTIYGGWGAGTGNDTLTGGAGADTFCMLSGTNTITDFVHGTDILQFSHAKYSAITTWASNEFYAAAGAIAGHISTDRIVYDTTTGNLYYDADGSGSGAAVLVALIGTTTHPTLDWNDIQLVA